MKLNITHIILMVIAVAVLSIVINLELQREQRAKEDHAAHCAEQPYAQDCLTGLQAKGY